MTELQEVPRWRRRLKLVLVATTVVALFSAPWWGRAGLQELTYFRVRRVEIEGTRYAAPDEIVSRLRVDTLASVWDDVSPLEARVLTHPQVESVRIRRRLPGTLIVRVVENPPVALVPTPRGLSVVDGRGRSLPVDPTAVDVDLPVLAGRDTVLLRLLAAVRAEAPALYARVSEARRTPEGDLLLVMPEFTVLGTLDLSVARLADLGAVELDLQRRALRARELDLRFRDQVIARLQ